MCSVHGNGKCTCRGSWRTVLFVVDESVYSKTNSPSMLPPASLQIGCKIANFISGRELGGLSLYRSIPRQNAAPIHDNCMQYIVPIASRFPALLSTKFCHPCSSCCRHVCMPVGTEPPRFADTTASVSCYKLRYLRARAFSIYSSATPNTLFFPCVMLMIGRPVQVQGNLQEQPQAAPFPPLLLMAKEVGKRNFSSWEVIVMGAVCLGRAGRMSFRR